jgi:hypothetical protein
MQWARLLWQWRELQVAAAGGAAAQAALGKAALAPPEGQLPSLLRTSGSVERRLEYDITTTVYWLLLLLLLLTPALLLLPALDSRPAARPARWLPLASGTVAAACNAAACACAAAACTAALGS